MRVPFPFPKVSKPNPSNAPPGKSKETRFEIVNVSSYSYTEDPSVDELEETSNTDDLTSDQREASQADELEEGEPSSDGLNSVEDAAATAAAANGSPHATTSSGRLDASASAHHLHAKPLTSTPVNQASTKSKPIINGVVDSDAASGLYDPKFSSSSSSTPGGSGGVGVAASGRGREVAGGASFTAQARDDQFKSSPGGSAVAAGSVKPGILTSGVVTPTGDTIVTSYTTSHGTWTTAGADFVQHSDSSMEPSRFRVVKIHSDKKIRRGRWQCQVRGGFDVQGDL